MLIDASLINNKLNLRVRRCLLPTNHKCQTGASIQTVLKSLKIDAPYVVYNPIPAFLHKDTGH